MVPLALKVAFSTRSDRGNPVRTDPGSGSAAHALVQELITNAVQASPPNKKVQVTVNRCKDGAVFSVTNLGFKPYQDEHTCYGRVNPERLGSKGIGLSITRAICDIFGHGFEIRSSKQDPLFRTVASALF